MSYASHPEALDGLDAIAAPTSAPRGGASDDPRRRTFARPDLTTFCRLEELGPRRGRTAPGTQNGPSWPAESPRTTDGATSNGPAEAINGRLEHLRGSALGFIT